MEIIFPTLVIMNVDLLHCRVHKKNTNSSLGTQLKKTDKDGVQ